MNAAHWPLDTFILGINSRTKEEVLEQEEEKRRGGARLP